MQIIDLSDTPYMGGLSVMRNEPQGGRKARGRARCNRQAPRTTQHSAPVHDADGNELSIGRRRKLYKPTAPATRRKSDLERYASIIGTHDLTGD